MKRTILVLLLALVSCGKTNDAEIINAFVSGDNPANAPVAHYEGTCRLDGGCDQFVHLEVREVKGDNYIYHEGILVKVEINDTLSIDKSGLICNYLERVR